MKVVNLCPFLRPHLDVLFVSLNPSEQSNSNGHYFSGRQSRFFDLLYKSGLLTEMVPKATADEIVFGSTDVNYGSKAFGVVDLVRDVVQTNSGKVPTTAQHVDALSKDILKYDPRFVCVIHYKPRRALNKYAGLVNELTYGICGALLPGSSASFVMNYFPNGNKFPDEKKLQIFRQLRDVL